MSRNNTRKNRKQNRQSPAEFERLEGRVLLSGTSTVAAASIFHEQEGVAFTVDLGKFATLAPGNKLTATINWGDGTTSAGTLVAAGPVGLDEVSYEVEGTHIYDDTGTFAIRTTVTRPGPAAPTTGVVVATLHDTAIVTSMSNLNLNGVITGTYAAAPVNPVISATWVFNGTGTAGVLDGVSAHGLITVPNAVLDGHATGSLMLTTISTDPANNGTMTLALTGPVQIGFGPVGIPSLMTYTITGGTGIYADAVGHGTIAIRLGTGGSSNGFTFTIVTGGIAVVPPITPATTVR